MSDKDKTQLEGKIDENTTRLDAKLYQKNKVIGEIIGRGRRGVGLEFDMDGNKLGIKREDEEEYEYVDLSVGIDEQDIINVLGYKPVSKKYVDERVALADKVHFGVEAPGEIDKIWIQKDKEG